MRSKWSRIYLAMYLALSAQLLLPALTCRSATESSASGGGSPMNPNWRAVLKGAAANELIDYCGRLDGAEGSWAPSASDLDTLERILDPLLTEDLKSEGSSLLASQYYRQYATILWQGHYLIYVNGFLKQDPAPPHWRKQVVRVSDGGPAYWCAFYVKDTKTFAPIRTKDQPPRTVAFHGHA